MVMMKKEFPMHEEYYGPTDYSRYDFDPEVDFMQFLEEARQHARETNPHSSLPHSEEAGDRRKAEEPKSKRSWKHSLFKWWKAERKSGPRQESGNKAHVSNLRRRGHNSGPIYGSSTAGVNTNKHRRPTSGPLAALFNSSKRVQNETPYMCLDQVDSSHGVRAYGPVYLVT